MCALSTALVLLTSSAADSARARDGLPGGAIVFVRSVRGPEDTFQVPPAIYRLDIATGTMTRLTDPARGAWDVSPAWSGSGKRIAFSRYTEPFDPSSQEIFVMRADGSNLRRLTRNSVSDSDPTWSPDGKYIAYTRSAPESRIEARRTPDLWRMRSDGSHQHRVRRTPRTTEVDPAWSPNGRLIAFLSYSRRGNAVIAVIRPDGTGRRVIARAGLYGQNLPEAFMLQAAAWAPNGRLLAYLSTRGTVGVSTLSGRRVADYRAGAHPTWAPGGRFLAVVRSHVEGPFGALYLLDRRSRHVTRLTPGTGPPVDDEQPSWRPTQR